MEKQDIKKRSALGHFLSGNLRFLRRNLKLSQEELAGQLSLNRGNIASYENGSAEPKICNLVKISRYFRISVSDLTEHDLTCELATKILPTRLQGLAPEEREKVNRLYQQSNEFNSFLNGVHSCYQYKISNINDQAASAKDIETLKKYFEELYEASTKMAEQHHALLNMCRCQAAKRDS